MKSSTKPKIVPAPSLQKTSPSSPGQFKIQDSILKIAEELSRKQQRWLEANKSINLSMFRPLKHLQKIRELHHLTCDHVRRDLIYPQENEPWQVVAAKMASHNAQQALQHLELLFEDSKPQTIEAVADIAIIATEFLGRVSKNHLKQVIPIARQRWLWPFLKASKERFGDKHKEMVKKIELGQDIPVSPKMRERIRPNNYVNILAVKYLCRLVAFEFNYFSTKKRLQDWDLKSLQKEAWELLLSDHGGLPERHSILITIGEYRSKHSEYIGQQKKVNDKTRDANIRDGIKEKFQKAIRRLLPNKFFKK